MLAEYLGVLIILALATILACVLLAVQWIAAPRRAFEEKQQPFESGRLGVSPPRGRIAIKFYRVAILFVVFSAQAVYFYPWGAVFRDLGLPGFVAIVLFTTPLAVGLAYEWAKGTLDW
jgi:NADH-quinone oxidoreductase subunit A